MHSELSGYEISTLQLKWLHAQMSVKRNQQDIFKN